MPESILIVVEALNVGFLQTLKLFIVTLLGALPLGLILSFGSMSNWAPFHFLTRWKWADRRGLRWLTQGKPLRVLTRTIIWIIRGTPLMLQLLVIFYFPGLVLNNPIWGGGESGRFLASAVAFIINYSCYFSEIFRSGIQGVPHGQQEAGLVLGMTRPQIFFKVTLLQMIKRIVPPMSNEIITLVKDTSLARIISLQEIIWAGSNFLTGSKGVVGIWPLFFTGIYYLLFNGLLTLLFSALERKLNYFRV